MFKALLCAERVFNQGSFWKLEIFCQYLRCCPMIVLNFEKRVLMYF